MYWENVFSDPSDMNVYSTRRHSPSRVPTRRRARACPSPGLMVTENVRCFWAAHVFRCCRELTGTGPGTSGKRRFLRQTLHHPANRVNLDSDTKNLDKKRQICYANTNFKYFEVGDAGEPTSPTNRGNIFAMKFYRKKILSSGHYC